MAVVVIGVILCVTVPKLFMVVINVQL